MQQEEVFGKLPMKKLILKMAAPLIISMPIQALYNMVDSLFVAQLGQKQLAALGIAAPIQIVIIAISNGIGAGLNSSMSRHSGAGETDKAGRSAAAAITLTVIAAAVLVLFGFFGVEPYFRACSYDAEVIEYGTQYLSICCIFMWESLLTSSVRESCRPPVVPSGDYILSSQEQPLMLFLTRF